MQNIELDSITENHLRGKWEVYNRVVNSGSVDNVFSDVRIIEIEPKEYRSINGKECIGRWTVIREKQIIYNPQLRFFINDTEVGAAIITRLIVEPTTNGESHKLTLYFSTGLELILKRTS